jgi:hypothetical protein
MAKEKGRRIINGITHSRTVLVSVVPVVSFDREFWYVTGRIQNEENVLQDITTCSLVGGCQSFGGT